MNATPNEDCDRGAFEELSDQLRAPVQVRTRRCHAVVFFILNLPLRTCRR